MAQLTEVIGYGTIYFGSIKASANQQLKIYELLLLYFCNIHFSKDINNRKRKMAEILSNKKANALIII